MVNVFQDKTNYDEHSKFIQDNFSDVDLLRESEFHLFKNKDFSLNCVNSCVDICNHVSEKLKINVCFSVQYNHTFNARASVKKETGAILLNLGLFNKLESIIAESIEIFSLESIAKFTIQESEISELKIFISELCITYITFHELAHVLQMMRKNSEETYIYQETDSDDLFNMKNHVYEIDADLFGVSMITYKLIEYVKNKVYPINSIFLFNILTTLLFCISNIIIAFSENKFETIYYKSGSHPHPLVRIMKCNNQILSSTSKNLSIREEFFMAVLQRTNTMIDQINYAGKEKLNYSKLINDNFSQIEKYIDEIEIENDSYDELVRFRIQDIFEKLIN